MRSLVTSTFLYVSESWTLTAELRKRIQAMEMRCYRKILRISCKDHVTNEEVRAKIQQAIGTIQRGKKTNQTEEDAVEVPEGCGEQGKIEETGCEIHVCFFIIYNGERCKLNNNNNNGGLYSALT